MRIADKKNKAFTLVELLVVIAIIGVLASFLMPALRNSISAAKTISCLNQMKQIGFGMQSYAGDHKGRLPYAGWGDNSAPKHISWHDLTREYFGGDPMTIAEMETQSWSADQSMKLLHCPGAQAPYENSHQTQLRNCTYVMPVQSGVAWHQVGGFVGQYTDQPAFPKQLKISRVKSPSGTMMLTENDCDGPALWFVAVQGGSSRMTWNPSAQLDSNGFGWLTNANITNYTANMHNTGIVNYLFVDGSVRSFFPLSEEVIGAGGSDTAPEGIWTRDPSD